MDTAEIPGPARSSRLHLAGDQLRTLLAEVNINARRDGPGPHAALVLRWKGGVISELTVPLRRSQPKTRTDEDTIDLIRRLAVHYPDAPRAEAVGIASPPRAQAATTAPAQPEETAGQRRDER